MHFKNPQFKLHCKLAMFTAIVLIAISQTGSAETPPVKQSSVKVKVTTDKTPRIIATAVLAPNDGLVINHDGPWKFAIKDAVGVKFNPPTKERGDFDDKIPGFTVPGEWASDSTRQGSFNYEFIAFVCTKNKDKCFRDVHRGSMAVSRGP
jgi:hypothetical protein